MRSILIVFLLIFALLPLGSSTLAHADATDASKETQLEKRSALNYTGWAVIKRQHLEPDAKDDEWISMRDIKMTDDGQILTLMDGDKETPYSVELIVITYQETNTTVLKLALYEKGKEPAITYIWGEPGAQRLGMNLRWMQVGLTRAE